MWEWLLFHVLTPPHTHTFLSPLPLSLTSRMLVHCGVLPQPDGDVLRESVLRAQSSSSSSSSSLPSAVAPPPTTGSDNGPHFLPSLKSLLFSRR